MTEISITLLFAEDKAKEYVRGEAAPPCKLYEYVPPHVVHFVSILGQNCVLYFVILHFPVLKISVVSPCAV